MTSNSSLFGAYLRPSNPPSSASSTSENSSLSSYTQHRAFPKSDIRVNLDNHFRSKVYTCGSPVSGNVTITTQRDVDFEKIEVVLLGVAKTTLDSVSAPQTSSHVFLRMTMPVPESTYPVPRVLDSGRIHTVPFNFVVPAHLTLTACGHSVASDHVREHHVALPPTVGSWERDDMAPRAVAVEYSIKARVYRQPGAPKARLSKVMEAAQAIQVLPTYPEQAPLSVTKRDKIYAVAKSKSLRRNLLSGRTGRLTVSGLQPGAVVLRPDGAVAAGTTAQLDLAFEPAAADVLPPRVTAVAGKLEAHTYYSSGAIPHLPNLGDWNQAFAAERRGSYTTSVPLFSTPLDGFSWAQQLSGQVRRDSGYGTDTASDDAGKPAGRGSAAAAAASPTYHTATVRVPVSLPAAKKTFIPSFHSCILSRVYTLALTVSVAPSRSSGSTTVTLRLPVQVAVEPAGGAGAGAGGGQGGGPPSFEAAVQDAEVDAFLRPRVLSVPDVEFQRTALPGYPA